MNVLVHVSFTDKSVLGLYNIQFICFNQIHLDDVLKYRLLNNICIINSATMQLLKSSVFGFN